MDRDYLKTRLTRCAEVQEYLAQYIKHIAWCTKIVAAEMENIAAMTNETSPTNTQYDAQTTDIAMNLIYNHLEHDIDFDPDQDGLPQ